MKRALLYFICLLAILSCRSSRLSRIHSAAVKERLRYPFGTVVKMKVEIVDGETLNDKGYQSDYLLKVKSVEGVPVLGDLVIPFRDETGVLPTGWLELRDYVYGKKENVSKEDYDKMVKEYVGHTFEVLAYETGEYSGMPHMSEEYSKYRKSRQERGYHFLNYLIVIHDFSKK